MNKSVHVYYAGSVQGVGFRFTAERLASSLGLTGWVVNLRDGRVEVVAEGKESAVTELLNKIDDIFGMYIQNKDVSWTSAMGAFNGFDIRFDDI